MGNHKFRVTTNAAARSTPASSAMAKVENHVAPGFAACTKPKITAETANASHVPAHSSTKRKMTPRKSASSKTASASSSNAAIPK
jgi:hypothetical protein